MALTSIPRASLEDVLCGSLQNWDVQHVCDITDLRGRAIACHGSLQTASKMEGRCEDPTEYEAYLRERVGTGQAWVMCVLYKRSSGPLCPKRQVLYSPRGPEQKGARLAAVCFIAELKQHAVLLPVDFDRCPAFWRLLSPAGSDNSSVACRRPRRLPWPRNTTYTQKIEQRYAVQQSY